MKKVVDISKEINDMRKMPANKKCFECGEIGTTYIVPDFGVFVCSICAGIHREFSHRVKGLSMSNFSLQELETLKRQGNEVCQRTWLARYNTRDFPQPSPKDTQRIKDFIRLKYKERRWYQDSPQDGTNLPPPSQVEPAQTLPMLPTPDSAPKQVVTVAPQPVQEVNDLLSLEDTPPPKSGDSWAEFQPPKNQVNIQISFQPPSKPEDRKPPPQDPLPSPPIQYRQSPPIKSEPFPPPPPAQPLPSVMYQATTIVDKPSPAAASPVTQKASSLAGGGGGYQAGLAGVQLGGKDPFNGLVESEGERQGRQGGINGNVSGNMRVFQQQYYFQSQVYTQVYGMPYPHTFQAWFQLVFPKPPSSTQSVISPHPEYRPISEPMKPRSNNPFDMFG